MKNLRTFITGLCIMSAGFAWGQDIVYTADGKVYITDLKTNNIKSLEHFAAIVNERTLRVSTADVVLVEYEESGEEILQPDKLNKVPAVAFEDNLVSFMARGKKVFVPYSSPHIQQRSGSLALRKLIENSGYYKVVRCEDEADFVLQYVFSDEGRDHAYLMVTDRMGNRIMRTTKVSARDFNPRDAGKESADELFFYFFENILFKGKLEKKAKLTKYPSEENSSCKYFVGFVKIGY